ncbi:unnamed protein product, partial [Haemonchus placei]|uniref:Ground-like domain-containing protein n=1 Tax=Haemonchus placei TaxID=6290 RepID=A0A0N4VTL8_HAEPC
QPRPPPPPNNGPPPPPPNNGPPPPPPNSGPRPPPPPPPFSYPPPRPTTTQGPYRPPTTPCTLYPYPGNPSSPCYVATNRDMQLARIFGLRDLNKVLVANEHRVLFEPLLSSFTPPNCFQTAIANTASVTSNLARVGRDYSSNNLLRQISNALQSIQYLYYDYVTLIMLSPAIAQMEAASTSASYYCRQQPVSPGALSNLGQNAQSSTENPPSPLIDDIRAASPPPTTTQGPFRPPTTPCSLQQTSSDSSSPCYIATNRDMQTTIANTVSITSTLARVGRDYSSVNLLRQISSALQSIQYQYYDYVTLIMLSPAIAQMKAAVSIGLLRRKICRKDLVLN